MTTKPHIETEAAKHVSNYDAFIEAGGDAKSERGERLFELASYWMGEDAKHQEAPLCCDECGDENLHLIKEGPDKGWYECAGHCALHNYR